MQVKVNTNDHAFKRELEINLTADEIQPVVLEERKKILRSAQVPGFRKGKAPQHLVEKRYGKTLIQDVIDHVVNDYYPKALDEADINPVKRGEISDLKYEKLGDDLSFKVETEIEPIIEVNDFSKMKFEKEIRTFREADLDDFFKYLLEERAENIAVDTPAEKDDFIVFDAVELDADGKEIPGKNYKDIRIKLGHGQFDIEVEKDLVGVKKGQNIKVTRDYPEDFEDKNLAGKTEHFSITVSIVERQKLPELNDDFAKSLGEFENLEQYKERLRETMKDQYQKDADSSLLRSVTDQMIEANPFDLPDAMIDYELDMMYYNTKAQGQKMDESLFRQYYREVAEKTVRWRIIKKALMKKEDIDVSEEEIKSYLLSHGWKEENLAEANANKYLIDSVKEEIVHQKVMDFITQKAKVVDVDITPGSETTKKTKASAGKKKAAAKKKETSK